MEDFDIFGNSYNCGQPDYWTDTRADIGFYYTVLGGYTMLQALLAFTLSWGNGIKYDASGSGGYGPVLLMRAHIGIMHMETGGWTYESSDESYIAPFRLNLWFSSGAHIIRGPFGAYPYVGIGWYTVHPEQPQYPGDSVAFEAFDGILTTAGVSWEWSVPRTHMSLYSDMGFTWLFNSYPCESLSWTMGGGLLFKIVE